LPLIYFPTSDSYDDSQSETARLGYVLRLNYNYDNKYYASLQEEKMKLIFLLRVSKPVIFRAGQSVGELPRKVG
jgi:hypothetical protein